MNGKSDGLIPAVPYPFCALVQNTDEMFPQVLDARAEAFNLVDQTERNKVYNRLMQIVYDRLYYTPVIEYADNIAYTDQLQGFWMSGPIYHYEDCYFA